MSEEFARLGCQVTGIDPSLASLETAHRHAESQSLTIHYQPGMGENIPFEDSSFDLVICCDVLEHVVDLEKTIREVTRVLKSGGILFYDTINRTEEARKSNIFAAQDFPLTSFFPKDTHTWDKFIQPAELLSVFERAGIENQEMTGLRAGLPDAQVAGLLIQRKLGLLNFAELGRKLQFRTGGGLESNYIGWAKSQNHTNQGK